MKKQFKIIILVCFSFLYLSFAVAEKSYVVLENQSEELKKTSKELKIKNNKTHRKLPDVQYLENKVKKMDRLLKHANNSLTEFELEIANRINELGIQIEKQKSLIKLLSWLLVILSIILITFITIVMGLVIYYGIIENY